MVQFATKQSWKNEPISNPRRIVISMKLSNEQFAKLKEGLIPRAMEDKWFIFFEDQWLYFHRSWTGFGIYKTKIIQQGNDYIINEFWAERNPERYSNNNDNSDREMLLFLIASGLLNIDVQEVYIQNNINSEADLLKSWIYLGAFLTRPANRIAGNAFDLSESIKSALLGVAVGDALGVPVEFKDREFLKKHPITDLIGYGTHNMPPGTFSDDSSLTFCLAEALTEDFNLNTIASKFVEWYYFGYWSARGDVFDIGNATQDAIIRIRSGVNPELAGNDDSRSNGNGSLMRILPLVFYLLDKEDRQERFEITNLVSSITHRHIRSVIACYYYLEFARKLLEGKDGFRIYRDLKNEVPEILFDKKVPTIEIAHFDRLFKENIFELPEEKIYSSGYVLHSLEASIWCLLTTENYESAVLKAVNLGEDTDTTAAITGGLAGILYGFDAIPATWKKELAKEKDIANLSERMGFKIGQDLHLVES